MDPVSSIMAQQHRRCDEHFSEMENAASAGDWEQAEESWKRFHFGTLEHFNNEEGLLFPEFESRTGMSMGPTQVMRMEHEQMRSLLDGLQQAIENRYAEQVLGVGETVMLMLQQHNMKEEQILYPMIDDAMGQDEAIQSQIKALPE